VACNSILDRAFGKPRLVKEEEKDSLEQRIANMTREQRLARMRELLEPMRQYLHERDEEEADAEVTTIEGGDRRRKPRPGAPEANAAGASASSRSRSGR
jgi:alkanesulfonate monooxygenase SsuD/methylene tetrahydromethanopterin reductase-like flavin-dependent oxidoreductase (luciferase family)